MKPIETNMDVKYYDLTKKLLSRCVLLPRFLGVVLTPSVYPKLSTLDIEFSSPRCSLLGIFIYLWC